MAWGERKEDEPLQEFVNRVGRLLKKEGRPKVYVQVQDPINDEVKLLLHDREVSASNLSKDKSSADPIANYPDPNPLPEGTEDLIQDWTAPLQGKEKIAVQHYLRSRLLEIEFKDYCQQHFLTYQTVHKAAMRGLERLRKKSP